MERASQSSDPQAVPCARRFGASALDIINDSALVSTTPKMVLAYSDGEFLDFGRPSRSVVRGLPVQDVEIAALRADCKIAGKFLGKTFSALTAITFREKGEEAAKRLWVLLLSQQQKGSYLEGLRKLGIRDDEPPAVKAAKYHYLSNQIGGLQMEYIEESPKKVWIRYNAPMWTYAGVTMMAIPGSVRRESGKGWHPKNGKLMGCPRLGWVATKCIMENEACDEGYFMEYDHDLAPGEEWRFEPATKTPEFDPSKAPLLDPEVWPESRRLKAGRNFSRTYVKTTVDCLFQMFGQQVTYYLVSQVMRGVAIQFTHEFKYEMGIEGSDAKSVAAFLYGLQRACGQDVQLAESRHLHRIILRTHLPFDIDASEGLRRATFEFAVMATRLINGRISLTRVPDGQREVWEVRDAERWLW